MVANLSLSNCRLPTVRSMVKILTLFASRWTTRTSSRPPKTAGPAAVHIECSATTLVKGEWETTLPADLVSVSLSWESEEKMTSHLHNKAGLSTVCRISTERGESDKFL
ncbi:hypothetical protein TNCV_1555401 [Trichonephila clavipes]|nr:hypothetical protein TNCV_1555401 [Trichonephila clavipes]